MHRMSAVQYSEFVTQSIGIFRETDLNPKNPVMMNSVGLDLLYLDAAGSFAK